MSRGKTPDTVLARFKPDQRITNNEVDPSPMHQYLSLAWREINARRKDRWLDASHIQVLEQNLAECEAYSEQEARAFADARETSTWLDSRNRLREGTTQSLKDTFVCYFNWVAVQTGMEVSLWILELDDYLK